MRIRFRFLMLAAPLAAGSLAAQRPLRRFAPRIEPVVQTLTFDVASAFQQHYRAMIEPLVFGRFTLGVSGEYTTHPDNGGYLVYPVEDCPPERLCAAGGTGTAVARDVAYPGYPPYEQNGGYRAWSFNLHGRWYPAALSFSGQRQSASFYVGEFIGYHERRMTQPIYYGCISCNYPPPTVDSTVFVPQSTPVPPGGGYGGYSSFTQSIHGWEPGAELGIRVQPMRHLVMDVGGRFRIARLPDYQSGKAPGDVESRLVVSVGMGW